MKNDSDRFRAHEDRALKAAEEWFAGKRPVEWTLAHHLLQWQVNCVSDAEIALADAVAALVSARRSAVKASEATARKLGSRRGAKAATPQARKLKVRDDGEKARVVKIAQEMVANQILKGELNPNDDAALKAATQRACRDALAAIRAAEEKPPSAGDVDWRLVASSVFDDGAPHAASEAKEAVAKVAPAVHPNAVTVVINQLTKAGQLQRLSSGLYRKEIGIQH